MLPHRTVGGRAVAQPGLNTARCSRPGSRATCWSAASKVRTSRLSPTTEAALRGADCVVAITPYASAEILATATVILPSAVFAETSGTWVNVEGRWQSVAGVARPAGEARPAWKILRVLGNLLGLAGFDYVSSEDVRDELQRELQMDAGGGTVAAAFAPSRLAAIDVDARDSRSTASTRSCVAPRRCRPRPTASRAQPGAPRHDRHDRCTLDCRSPSGCATSLVALGQILAVTITVILCVAYTTLAERKVIGYMQVRIGPNRVGPLGLLQPFADVIKLLLKEVVVPSRSNRYLFVVAPLLTLTPAFAAWAVMSLWPGFSVARRRRGRALHPRARGLRRLRHHPRRLGGQLEVRVPRRHALGGADRRLRDRDGLRAGRRGDGGGHAQHRHASSRRRRAGRAAGTGSGCSR